MILGAGGVIMLLSAAWGLRTPTQEKRADSLEPQA